MGKLVLDPPLNGDSLEKRLTERTSHEPIAEGFLYREASLMISSQPSIGKSVLAIQAAIELSNGLPLFGSLRVPSPIKVWYIQAERSDTESIERIKLMTKSATTPFSFKNLYLDTQLQSLNFLNPEHFTEILERGHSIKPDLIIIDPLYGLAGGLSKDEVACGVTKNFTILKSELKCALWINHHTVKSTYDIVDGKKVEKGDPFYGAQWLKAHVTGSYLAVMGEKGVSLTCKKDSHGILMKSLDFEFDEDNYLSELIEGNVGCREKYNLFLNSVFKSPKRTFYLTEALEKVGCIVPYIRLMNREPQISSRFKLHKSKGKKTLYEVIK